MSAPAKTRATLRHPQELAQAGFIAAAEREALERVAARYAIAITPTMADLVDGDDPDDPIARQFVPDERELDQTPQERDDPIGDHAHSPVEGIVHRYPDRVLLKLVHVCPVYCRFCFRREMVGPGQPTALDAATLDAALAYIAACPDIWEVVITGGDPLILSPRRLAEVVARLRRIDHVKVLRWHTRVPVVAPERISPALVEAIRTPDKATYVVLHANHPREFGLPARAACARLVDAGIVMLSQSVLLRGVNNDPATLGGLMRTFVENRIKPYYLHHGDLAPGTGHFRTGIAEGQALVRALRGHYSGLCQPTYVLDIPGGHGKAPLNPCDAEETGARDRWRVTDFRGNTHLYPPE
ncbi:MAG: lysine-2,3-aminomutase-like protein [Pseudochelatococcus sp.]|jgi:lysine 2,3-aminomutase|uniref:lysine-2,3-aminomutase-like protein n=1 Tax=Pseudochelatococcus sp. TaxID=2020869 RepID=UPI003D911B2D